MRDLCAYADLRAGCSGHAAKLCGAEQPQSTNEASCRRYHAGMQCLYTPLQHFIYLLVHTSRPVQSISASCLTVCKVLFLSIQESSRNTQTVTHTYRVTASGVHASDWARHMQALGLTLEYGWGINVGGGMHHASHSAGGGWCVYDDWMLAVRKLRQASNGTIQKAMMIDLDVHQVCPVLPASCPVRALRSAEQGPPFCQ